MRNTHVRTVVEPNLDLRLLRLNYLRGIRPHQECRSEGYELPNLTLHIGRMRAAHASTRSLGIVLPGLRYHVHKPSPNLRNYGYEAQALPSSFWTSHSRIGPFRVETFPAGRVFPTSLKLLAYPISTLKPFTPMGSLGSEQCIRNLASMLIDKLLRCQSTR